MISNIYHTSLHMKLLAQGNGSLIQKKEAPNQLAEVSYFEYLEKCPKGVGNIYPPFMQNSHQWRIQGKSR